MTGKDFHKLFLQAVDDAFSSLGDSARQSIYFHLETRFGMPRDEIPNRLEDFENGLEKIFGAGTKFLEILIMKRLYEMMEPKRRIMKWNDDNEFKFIDYVKATEQSFYKKKRKP
ncbi:MAG: hypothetical protein WCD81_00225 [Candidatus Bathyarchaeia archaeon]